MKKLKLKDIAEEFNVSISTVSKALSDSYEISEATRIKIQDYAKQHNYTPNINAISLKNSQTKTIALIIPNMLDYFYSQVLKGIEKTALEYGYKILTCLSNESHNKETEILKMLANGSVDGFILSVTKATEALNNYSHIQIAIDRGYPVVMFDSVTENIICDKIVVDEHKAMKDAVIRLHKSGCKHIGFATSEYHLESRKKMFEGYKEGLQIAGLQLDESIVVLKQLDHYTTYKKALKPVFNSLLDGFIATNESLAIAALQIAQKRNLKVPNAFSVIGFSNGILSRHSSPKLTSISKHGEKMGEMATRLLIEKLELENKTQKYSTKVLKTDIVERKTTRLLS